MTLVKALRKNRLDSEVKIIAQPRDREDWEIPDDELKDRRSWIEGLRNEREKIEEYQDKGDVAEWDKLKEYLVHHSFL